MSFISFVQSVITQYIATIIVLNSNLLGQLRIRKIKYFILIYSFYNYLPYFIYILASDLHNYFSQLKNFFQQFLMGRYVDNDFSWVLKTCFFLEKIFISLSNLSNILLNTEFWLVAFSFHTSGISSSLICMVSDNSTVIVSF